MGGSSQCPRKRKDNRIGFSFPDGTQPMGILDEAIREHLELKRRTARAIPSCSSSRTRPSVRPIARATRRRSMPLAEAPTEFMAQPETPRSPPHGASRRSPTPGAAPAARPEAEPEAPSEEAAPVDEAPAEEEQPAMEHEIVDELPRQPAEPKPRPSPRSSRPVPRPRSATRSPNSRPRSRRRGGIRRGAAQPDRRGADRGGDRRAPPRPTDPLADLDEVDEAEVVVEGRRPTTRTTTTTRTTPSGTSSASPTNSTRRWRRRATASRTLADEPEVELDEQRASRRIDDEPDDDDRADPRAETRDRARGRARGDAGLPGGDPRGRPALVRAEAAQGLRLRRLRLCGSDPAGPGRLHFLYGAIAQLAERSVCIAKVAGSIPAGSTELVCAQNHGARRHR